MSTESNTPLPEQPLLPLQHPTDGATPLPLSPLQSGTALPPLPAVMRNAARAAYERYGVPVGGVNYQGKPLPTFDELPALIQFAWVCSLPPVEAKLQQFIDELQWGPEATEEIKAAVLESLRAFAAYLRT